MADHIEAEPPPHDSEAEAACLGCLLLDPTFPASKRVLSDLEPDDFYVGSHRGVFRAAKVLHIQGTPPDSILVRGYLRDHKEQVHATIDNDDFVAALIARGIPYRQRMPALTQPADEGVIAAPDSFEWRWTEGRKQDQIVAPRQTAKE